MRANRWRYLGGRTIWQVPVVVGTAGEIRNSGREEWERVQEDHDKGGEREREDRCEGVRAAGVF